MNREKNDTNKIETCYEFQLVGARSILVATDKCSRKPLE